MKFRWFFRGIELCQLQLDGKGPVGEGFVDQK